jgi:hypothetical protein
MLYKHQMSTEHPVAAIHTPPVRQDRKWLSVPTRGLFRAPFGGNYITRNDKTKLAIFNCRLLITWQPVKYKLLP